jgi:hypothetical protein
MIIRRVAVGYAFLCSVMVCVLPVIYLLTQDYSVVERLPFPAVCLTLLLEFPIIPAGLIVGLILLIGARPRWSRFGAAVGLALGLWLTTAALGIPYCGFYPNLPALLLLTLLSGLNQGPDPRITFAVIFVTNLVIYPTVGCLIGLMSSLAARPMMDSKHRTG